MTATHKRGDIVWWYRPYWGGPSWSAGRVVRCGPLVTRVLVGPYILQGSLAGSSEMSIATKDLVADSPETRALADLVQRRRTMRLCVRDLDTVAWSPERLDAMDRVLDNTLWEPAR